MVPSLVTIVHFNCALTRFDPHMDLVDSEAKQKNGYSYFQRYILKIRLIANKKMARDQEQ